jgi:hypothetical protein
MVSRKLGLDYSRLQIKRLHVYTILSRSDIGMARITVSWSSRVSLQRKFVE